MKIKSTKNILFIGTIVAITRNLYNKTPNISAKTQIKDSSRLDYAALKKQRTTFMPPFDLSITSSNTTDPQDIEIVKEAHEFIVDNINDILPQFPTLLPIDKKQLKECFSAYDKSCANFDLNHQECDNNPNTNGFYLNVYPHADNATIALCTDNIQHNFKGNKFAKIAETIAHEIAHFVGLPVGTTKLTKRPDIIRNSIDITRNNPAWAYHYEHHYNRKNDIPYELGYAVSEAYNDKHKKA